MTNSTDDKALEAALLACPFCGGAPEEHWSNSTTKHFIQCGGCGARTSINLASHGGSARDEWNRRVPVSPLPGEAEVVAWLGTNLDGESEPFLEQRQAEFWSNGAFHAEPLVTLASFQAMQARAEAAEKERDEARLDRITAERDAQNMANQLVAAEQRGLEKAGQSLAKAEQALKDWLHVYAPDLCEPEEVFAAQGRIGTQGTIAYIADALAAIRSLGDKT